MNIHKSTSAYESWLRAQLLGAMIDKDLDEKHEKMSNSAFVFLRATYWRWAERIPDLFPKLNEAPTVLAVGDIHVENFGTWRDEDGRLVWGVNDFDEAAEMPYVFDLLRLAVSAFLGQSSKGQTELSAICANVLKGYQMGLENPRPYILDKDHHGMRAKFVASEPEREKFWDKMKPKPGSTKQPSPQFKASLDSALPRDTEPGAYWPRSAGVGSLGRPRWVVRAQWKGGPVVREAKAVVPSGWNYARKHDSPSLRIADIARGRYRAPDPWFRISKDNVAVRRLSPNNHKIEMETLGQWLFEHDLLVDMGFEIANIHLGSKNVGTEILAHIRQQSTEWLAKAAEQAAECTAEDFEDWKKG